MPVTLPKPEPDAAPVPTPNRIRWTRHQCDAIREAGILTGRYELIDGEIILKSDPWNGEKNTTMGHKRPHAVSIVLLVRWLISVFGGDRVQCQLPIDVAASENETNEPEPEAAVFTQPVTAYVDHAPGPGDLLLVVEVSDTTLRFDLTAKAALYARAGIADYWAMDVVGRQIIVHRNPNSEGYQEITAYAENELVAPIARPDSSVRVADLFPPESSEPSS